MGCNRSFLKLPLVIFSLFFTACSFKAMITDLSSQKQMSLESANGEQVFSVAVKNIEDDYFTLTTTNLNTSDYQIAYTLSNTINANTCYTATKVSYDQTKSQYLFSGLAESSAYLVVICKDSSVLSSMTVVTKSYCDAKNRMTNSPFANSGEFNSDSSTICTPEQLNSIGLNTTYLSNNFKLKADIDLAGLTINNYNIIAKTGNFSGVFDGNNHKIKNLTYSNNTQNCLALICSANGANIMDLTLENFSLTGQDNVAALVSNMSSGTISRIIIMGGTIKGRSTVAGLIANSGANITNAQSNAQVIATADTAGGLVGNHNSGSIQHCFATGNVTANSTAGGLIGGSYGGLIFESFASGNITAVSGDIAGGLVGSLWTTMNKVYATGNVQGRDYVGGLVGDFVSSDVSDCYSTGNVTGRSWIGGLIGHFYGNSLNRCYSSGNATGTSSQVGGMIGLYQSGSVSDSFSVGSVSGASASNYTGLSNGQRLSGISTNVYYNSSATCLNSLGYCNSYGTGINVNSDPTYFFNKNNPPLTVWDFTNNLWKSSATELPKFTNF